MAKKIRFNAEELTISAVDAGRRIDDLQNKMAALESRLEVVTLTNNQVADLFTRLKDTMNYVADQLETPVTYTQEEIARMGAEEYRDKILIPLGMGRRS